MSEANLFKTDFNFKEKDEFEVKAPDNEFDGYDFKM